MILDYALPKTGHPNCRQPDKVIDAGQQATPPVAQGYIFSHII